MAGVDGTIGNWVRSVETSGELKHGQKRIAVLEQKVAIMINTLKSSR